MNLQMNREYVKTRNSGHCIKVQVSQKISLKEDRSEAGRSSRKRGLQVSIIQEDTPQGKRTVGTPRQKWKNRVKEDVEKMRSRNDWIELSLDTKRNIEKNLLG